MDPAETINENLMEIEMSLMRNLHFNNHFHDLKD